MSALRRSPGLFSSPTSVFPDAAIVSRAHLAAEVGDLFFFCSLRGAGRPRGGGKGKGRQQGDRGEMERGRGKGGNICPSWTDLLAPLLAGMLPGGFLFLGKLCGRTDLHGGRMQGQLARVCEGGGSQHTYGSFWRGGGGGGGRSHYHACPVVRSGFDWLVQSRLRENLCSHVLTLPSGPP